MPIEPWWGVRCILYADTIRKAPYEGIFRSHCGMRRVLAKQKLPIAINVMDVAIKLLQCSASRGIAKAARPPVTCVRRSS